MNDETNKGAAKREPFKIVVNDPMPFDPIAQSKYLTSNDLCKCTSTLFREIFADWEGCIFDTSSGGEATISFIFNHGQYSENAITCCEKKNGKAPGNSIIDRTRYRDRQLQNGDRYFLSDDGRDAIIELLSPKIYNNGNPNWKMIVSEWTDRTISNMYNMRPTQFTKVSFIDLGHLCRLLFGSKINGDSVDYSVTIMTPLTPNNYQTMGNGFQMNTNYMLNITRAYSKEVKAIYEQLGFGNMGTNIVR